MKLTGVQVAQSGVNQGGNSIVDPTIVQKVITWISGDVAGLAISSGAVVAFDLGENWQSLGRVQVSIEALASSLSCDVCFNPSSLVWVSANRAMNAVNGNQFLSAAIDTTAGGFFIPFNRYLIARVSNGATAVQGVGACVRVIGYPA